MTTPITITYNTSVFTAAGWRSETVTARARPISAKRARVIEVLDVGGHGTTGYASRTGANRQTYHVGGVAQREVGKIKILSACSVVHDDDYDPIADAAHAANGEAMYGSDY